MGRNVDGEQALVVDQKVGVEFEGVPSSGGTLPKQNRQATNKSINNNSKTKQIIKCHLAKSHPIIPLNKRNNFF